MVTFADNGTGLPYQALTMDMGVDYLYTRTIVSRLGGGTEQFTDDTAADLYGIRTLAVDGVLVDSDAQSYDMGLFLLGIYATPTQRVSSLTVVLGRLTSAQQADVIALDLGDVVTVVFRPNQVGPPVVADCAVEGIDIDAVPGSMTVTVHLGDTVNRQVFILDDPTWGVLDGPGVLAF